MVTRWIKIKRTVLQWIYKKSKDAYKSTRSLDMRCPNCREWFSISGIEHQHDYIKPEPDFGASVKCGKCKHVSHWNLVAAPLPLYCDENGTPIQDEEDGENRCSIIK